MRKEFDLEILTPQGVQLHSNVFSVSIKTNGGMTTFLAAHEPMIASVRISNVDIITSEGKMDIYAIGVGVLKFINNKLTIITDFFRKNENKANPSDLRKMEINAELKNSKDEISSIDKFGVTLEEEIGKLKN
jgi:F0F1-type ATP synthase epsilon subunit